MAERAGGAFVELEPRLAQGFEASVQKQVDPLMKRIGHKISTAGVGMTKALTAPILAGAAAIGVGAVKIDAALDTIRIKTGLTGQDLTKVEGVFRSVAARVPNDFGEVADAVSLVRARMGDLSEGELAGLSKNFLTLARITKQDVNTVIEEQTRLLGDWGISARDSGAALDFLVALSQKTGVSIDGISQKLVQFGGPLRQLGFGFEESAALIAKFEKEGVNTELVLGSMRIALGKMAKEGEAPAETLRRTIREIKNAGDAGKANALALELFGARAGPDMAAAIREGRFEVDGLLATLGDTSGALQNTAKDTDGFGETLKRFRNRALLAIEPLATKLVSALDGLVPKLEPVFDFVERLVEGFTNLSPKWQLMIGGALAFAAALGPILMVLGPIITLLGAILSPVGLVVAAIAALAVGFVIAYQRSEEFREVVAQVVAAVSAKVGELVAWWQTMLPKISEAVGHVVTVVRALWQQWGDELLTIARAVWESGIVNVVRTALAVVQGIIQTVLAVINGDWGQAWEGVKQIVGAAFEFVKTIVANALTIVVSILKIQLDVARQIWSAGWEALKSALGAIWEGIKGAVSSGIEGVLGFVRSLPGRIRDAVGDLGGLLVDAGRDLIEGLINGIKAKAKSAADSVLDVVNPLAGLARRALEARSPSRVFQRIGEDVAAGFVVGITGRLGEVRDAAGTMVQAAIETVTDTGIPVLVNPATGFEYDSFWDNHYSDPNAGKPGYVQAEDGSWVPTSFYRMHSGGIVPGEPGDEVLVLAEAGERVTPAGEGLGPLYAEIVWQVDGRTLARQLVGPLSVEMEDRRVSRH